MGALTAAARPRPRLRDLSARSWWTVARRTVREVRDDDVPMLSAGVAFWWLIALFPAIVAIFLAFGLVADTEQLQRQVGEIGAVLPAQAQQDLVDQARRLAGASQRSIGFGLVFSLLAAMWTTSAGVSGMIKAINVAYDVEETRTWVRRRAFSLGITAGVIIFLTVTIGLALVFPVVLEATPLLPDTRAALQVLRWPVLVAVFAAAVTMLYRFAPAYRPQDWRLLSVGALIATALWVLASVAFSVYVDVAGTYENTYGRVAGVALLLLWLFATAFVLLLGAEIDSEARRLARELDRAALDRAGPEVDAEHNSGVVTATSRLRR